MADNIGLINALKQSKQVIPLFIFTPEQVIKNPYKSNNAVQFMVESLIELDKDLKKVGSRLCYFFAKPELVIQKLVKKENIEAVFVNRDYTPYAKKRDDKIEHICKKQGIDFKSFEDVLLNPVGAVRTGAQTPYTKYTPYFNKAWKIKVQSPINNKYTNYSAKRVKIVDEYVKDIQNLYTNNSSIAVHGGRSNGLAICKKIKEFRDYDKKRNLLEYETTRLSAYIKFGCVSIREVYHACKKIASKDLLRQLYWRDFYYNIAYFFPRVFGKAMKEQYDAIKWVSDNALFNKWKKGQTGFPVVDACMRELNTTGFMHNRGRLITSNFLIKLLGIDWRKGETYFANQLVDYDPAVNNGNWQWSASTGADSQPYFRIFNPWLQSKKFDATGEYIKKWVPELQAVSYKDIHNWETAYKKYKNIAYPKPIIEYTKARRRSLALYKFSR